MVQVEVWLTLYLLFALHVLLIGFFTLHQSKITFINSILRIELNCFCVGAQKLAKIRENSNFFRSELQKMGFEVLGDNDSPVMPIMLYNPAKIPAFSRECLRQNVSASTFYHLCSLLMLYITGMDKLFSYC